MLALGDGIEIALNAIGISKERVEKWIGRPCHCKERQEKLNALGFWAARVISGKIERASEFLTKLLEEH